METKPQPSVQECCLYLSRYLPTTPRKIKLDIARSVARAGYVKHFKESVGCVLLPTEGLPDEVIVAMYNMLKGRLGE